MKRLLQSIWPYTEDGVVTQAWNYVLYRLPVFKTAVVMCSFNCLMSLIHYSFVPLILFLVPYTLDSLPYYLSIANGAGGVGIFELLIFQCFV